MNVSVIAPTFNDSSRKLAQTINSVLEQTYDELELIVVDDGSKIPFDGLNTRIADPRLRWVSLAENGGVAKARNKAIEVAKGDYIAFIDTGDWWETNKLARQIQHFKGLDETYGLVYCAYIAHFWNDVRIVSRPKCRGNIARLIYENQCISGSCSAVLLRRGCIDDVGGFYEAEDIPEDWDLWIRIAQKYKVDFVDEILVHLQVERYSRSFDPEKKAITYRRLLELHQERIHALGMWNRAISYYHYVIARKYADRNRYGKVFLETLYSLYCHPNFKSLKVPLVLILKPLLPLFRSLLFRWENK